jgi:hypothetical protein
MRMIVSPFSVFGKNFLIVLVLPCGPTRTGGIIPDLFSYETLMRRMFVVFLVHMQATITYLLANAL